jgi:hypothetical protein
MERQLKEAGNVSVKGAEVLIGNGRGSLLTLGKERVTVAAEKQFPFGQPVVWKPSDAYLRRVIRAAYLGETPGDLSALVNPEVVEAIQRAA